MPARNEKGNMENAIIRTPKFGTHQEFIFIEGHSSDGTYEEMLRVQQAYPEVNMKVMRQTGKGKGNAVREAFAVATVDILMILDADLTTPPEDMPKFYGWYFSYLLGQQLKDTLCGTKVFFRNDYERIIANRHYFGDFDPLFGAAKLNMKITEVIVRDRDREYGSTQISRFSHGWLLIKMSFFAARKIKFK